MEGTTRKHRKYLRLRPTSSSFPGLVKSQLPLSPTEVTATPHLDGTLGLLVFLILTVVGMFGVFAVVERIGARQRRVTHSRFRPLLAPIPEEPGTLPHIEVDPHPGQRTRTGLLFR